MQVAPWRRGVSTASLRRHSIEELNQLRSNGLLPIGVLRDAALLSDCDDSLLPQLLKVSGGYWFADSGAQQAILEQLQQVTAELPAALFDAGQLFVDTLQ